MFNALHDSIFFEGPAGVKLFSHDLPSLEKGHYRMIGQLVAMSLSQGGPAIHFLSPDLYDLMTGSKKEIKDIGNLPENISTMIQLVKHSVNRVIILPCS